jgi:hypothetical protein
MAGSSSNPASSMRKGAWGMALSRLFEIWTSVAMATLFFAVLTPVGLVMRLAGRDPLCLRFQSQQPSYWVPRASYVAQHRSMAKQF